MADPSQLELYCLNEREQAILQTYNIILVILYSIAATLILVITGLYIRAKMTTNFIAGSCKFCRCLNCNLYWLGLVLFVSCLAYFVAGIIARATHCNFQYGKIYRLSSSIESQSYLLNYFTLIAILFARLIAIFEDTEMRVSQQFVAIFWCLFVSGIACGVFAVWVFSDHGAVSFVILLAISGVLALALMVTLASAFVYKLLAVYQGSASASDATNNDRLKRIITKSSMLSSISLSLSFITFIAAELAQVIFVNNVPLTFVYYLCACIDIVSNAVCILLTFAHFDPVYQSLCTTCHARWMQCWTKSANVSREAMEEEMTLMVGN